MTSILAPDMIEISRVFTASVETVFRAWTDPAWIRQWSWGKKYETISIDIDCRAGGIYKTEIRDRNTGERWFFDGSIDEVVPCERFAHTFDWTSDRGVNHGKSHVIITFVPQGAETLVVITHSRLTDEAVRKGTLAGWIDVCDCIERCLLAVVESGE